MVCGDLRLGAEFDRAASPVFSPDGKRLAVRDADSGRPAAGRVVLGRLVLPESKWWSAGDEIQARLDVPITGAVVRELPKGRRRLECASQGRSRPGPPEFELGEAKASIDVLVHVYVPDGAVLGVATTFVAVVAPADRLVVGVKTSGTEEPPARGDIRQFSWSEAAAFPSPAPPDAWRTAPIHVTAYVEGYEPLEFVWTVSTAGVPHVLVPKSPK